VRIYGGCAFPQTKHACHASKKKKGSEQETRRTRWPGNLMQARFAIHLNDILPQVPILPHHPVVDDPSLLGIWLGLFIAPWRRISTCDRSHVCLRRLLVYLVNHIRVVYLHDSPYNFRNGMSPWSAMGTYPCRSTWFLHLNL
jgi:hypothetical protein